MSSSRQNVDNEVSRSIFIRKQWYLEDIGVAHICTLKIRVFEISRLQSMDGDGTFISLMAQHFQQDYEHEAFGRMTSATSPLWAVCALRRRVNPRLRRIHPLWKGGWGGGGADGGLLYGITPYYPCYDANGNVTEYVNGTSGSTAAYYRYDAYMDGNPQFRRTYPFKFLFITFDSPKLADGLLITDEWKRIK